MNSKLEHRDNMIPATYLLKYIKTTRTDHIPLAHMYIQIQSIRYHHPHLRQQQNLAGMCIQVSYRYHCGHEYTQYYQQCPINIAAHAGGPSEICNVHDHRIERQNALCRIKACQRLEKSWGCCQCKQGPNTSMTCEQSPSSPAQKCGHVLCKHCPGWDCFKKLREM